jgi:uncharacterized protein YjbI with pentapeptide repeats
MCEYKFRDGDICKEEALQNSKYCILHIDLPEDEESEEFKRINKLKEEKVKEKVDRGDFNFEGAKLLEINFYKVAIKGNVNFKDVVIIRYASFSGAEIGRYASFSGVKIGRYASFSGVKIGRDAWFEGAEIGGNAWFEGAEIGGNAWFKGAKIGGNASFEGAEIGETASFFGAKIGGNALFDRLEIKGKLSFRDAIFEKPEAQEESCRKAKRIWEEIGDRIEVDYYFYREMEAKRKLKYLKFSLKPILKLIHKLRLEKQIRNHIEFFEKKRRIYRGFLELPIQYIFGYGVYPWRVIATWFITVFSLAFVYWLGKGVVCADGIEHLDLLSEYIYFSIVTAATPGYGGYKPVPGFYQNLASFEAIFGTFMWAAFIATFARKYMR